MEESLNCRRVSKKMFTIRSRMFAICSSAAPVLLDCTAKITMHGETLGMSQSGSLSRSTYTSRQSMKNAPLFKIGTPTYFPILGYSIAFSKVTIDICDRVWPPRCFLPLKGNHGCSDGGEWNIFLNSWFRQTNIFLADCDIRLTIVDSIFRLALQRAPKLQSVYPFCTGRVSNSW